MASPLRVVCVQTGDAYGDEYVTRLVSMVGRHLQEPHQVTCVVDRPRAALAGIDTIDASGWGLQGWFNKLRLFDQTLFGDAPFLYLDISLIVKKDLAPLLEFARSAPEQVLGVADWHYDSVNTCCLWIRPGSVPHRVWRYYQQDPVRATSFPSDQDFVNEVLVAQEGSLGYFPKPMVASYKNLRRLRHRSRAGAAQALDEAIILKFHGAPKPHELLDRRLTLRRALAKSVRRPSSLLLDWGYLVGDIKRWWR